jgi:Na+-transporting methylmalonyl-CoA/oxaloacetate decarboxylase gamma subunit
MMILAATNWANAGLIALVSICLVFTMLVLLIFILKLFGVIFRERKKAEVAAPVAASSDEISDEEVAAIAMAVNLFFNRHDEESDVLTFRQNHDVSAWQVRNINKQL